MDKASDDIDGVIEAYALRVAIKGRELFNQMKVSVKTDYHIRKQNLLESLVGICGDSLTSAYGDINWDPSKNDIDSFRLFVALSLRVECQHDGYIRVWKGRKLLCRMIAVFNDDEGRRGAVRHAVVYAAEKIAKQMKEQDK